MVAVTRKRNLALCYDSQVSDKEVEQIAGFCLRYDGRERLWVNAAALKVGLASRHAGADGGS